MLDSYAQPGGVRLMKCRAGSPWLEFHNLSPDTMDLRGFLLTFDQSGPVQWALPAGSLADGEFLVIRLDSGSGGGRSYIRLGPMALRESTR